jgi:CheY-like chemotaxis protein
MTMRKKVVIIEDDPGCREVISVILHLQGFEVHAHADGSNYKTLLSQLQPDLLLVDHQLPGIKGGDICTSIRQDGAYSHIPVILISAHNKLSLSRFVHYCSAFIEKPFDLQGMVQTIRQVLSGQISAPGVL